MIGAVPGIYLCSSFFILGEELSPEFKLYQCVISFNYLVVANLSLVNRCPRYRIQIGINTLICM